MIGKKKIFGKIISYLLIFVSGLLFGQLILATRAFTEKLTLFGISVNIVFIFFGFLIIVPFYRYLNIRQRLLYVFIAGIFFWVDKNMFFRSHHAGGAFGLSVGVIDIVLIVSLFYHLLHKKETATEEFSFFPFVSIPYLLLIVMNFLTVFLSIDPQLSMLEIIRLLKGLFVFLLVANMIQDVEDIKKISLFLVFMVFGESLLCLAQFFMKRTIGLNFLGEETELYVETLTEGTEVTRISGTFGNPHSLAGVFGFIIPLIVCLVLCSKKVQSKWLYIFVLFTGLSALIVTYLRSVLVALGLVLVLIFILTIRKGYWDRSNKKFFIVILIMGIVTLVPFLPSFFKRMFYAEAGSVDVRLDFIKISMNMFERNPFLGVGINTYNEFFTAMGDPLALNDRMPGGNAVDHNFYILTLAETGIAGLLALIVLWFSVFRLAVPCFKSDNTWFNVIGLALIGGYTNFFMRSLISYEYRLDQVFVFFWFISGFLAGVYRLVKRGVDERIPI
ncbi:MAG: O-antigen ligase family protein [Spirochaetales bacterium]|nr:O-antigen ligase family protein [Spirochaetales bacterium]